jgi:hypothetical protein
MASKTNSPILEISEEPPSIFEEHLHSVDAKKLASRPELLRGNVRFPGYNTRSISFDMETKTKLIERIEIPNRSLPLARKAILTKREDKEQPRSSGNSILRRLSRSRLNSQASQVSEYSVSLGAEYTFLFTMVVGIFMLGLLVGMIIFKYLFTENIS